MEGKIVIGTVEGLVGDPLSLSGYTVVVEPIQPPGTVRVTLYTEGETEDVDDAESGQ